VTRRARRGGWGGAAREVEQTVVREGCFGFLSSVAVHFVSASWGSPRAAARCTVFFLFTPPSAGSGRLEENNKKCVRARQCAEVRRVAPPQRWPAALLVVSFPFAPTRGWPTATPRLLRSRASNPRGEIRRTHWSGPPMNTTARPRVCGRPRLAGARHCGGWRGGAAARGPRSRRPRQLQRVMRDHGDQHRLTNVARACSPRARPTTGGRGVCPLATTPAHSAATCVRRTATRHRRSRGHRPPPVPAGPWGGKARAPPPAAARAVRRAHAPRWGALRRRTGDRCSPHPTAASAVARGVCGAQAPATALARWTAAVDAPTLAPYRRPVSCCLWVGGARRPSCRCACL